MLKEILNFISVKTPFLKSKYQQQNNFWTFRLMFLGLNAIYIILICIHHEKIWPVFFICYLLMDKCFMTIWLIMPHIAKYFAKHVHDVLITVRLVWDVAYAQLLIFGSCFCCLCERKLYVVVLLHLWLQVLQFLWFNKFPYFKRSPP